MSDPEGDRTDDVDMDEAVGRLMEVLRPREQEVLALRFGLGGKARLSLSQVGKVLEVSKERVRQIQDRALEKLRAAAASTTRTTRCCRGSERPCDGDRRHHGSTARPPTSGPFRFVGPIEPAGLGGR